MMTGITTCIGNDIGRYVIYRAAGWHAKPSDPEIGRTDDEEQAAMTAGCRIDLHMPGGSNRYDCYAVDSETGEEVERIDSYQCQECGQLCVWGDDDEAGPIGTKDGRILECPGAHESHTVHWVCEDCACEIEEGGDDPDWLAEGESFRHWLVSEQPFAPELGYTDSDRLRLLQEFKAKHAPDKPHWFAKHLAEFAAKAAASDAALDAP